MNAEKIATLRCMLDELESHSLSVQLAPAPRPQHACHCVRVVVDRNARWYREFCAAYGSRRRRKNPRPDTAIRRAGVLAALRAMIEGRVAGPVYAERLTIAARIYWRRNRAKIAALVRAEAA